MNQSDNQSHTEASVETDESGIHSDDSGPLPLFGYCAEIHTSNAPLLLPVAGEADEHEQKLFAAPWEGR